MACTTPFTTERHWTKFLTTTIRPRDRQVQELERARNRLQLDHDTFASLVRRSPASLRRICEHEAAKVFRYYSDVSLSELLVLTYSAIVLTVRLEGTEVRVNLMPGEFQNQVSNFAPDLDRRLKKIVRDVDNLDDLVEHMLTEPEFEAYAQDPLNASQQEVDSILGWKGIGRRDKGQSFDHSEPTWLAEIPPSLRPDRRMVSALEELRVENRIPLKRFAVLVLKSPGITKMIFEQQFLEFRQRRPQATDKELFETIIQFRFYTNDLSDGMTPEDARERLREPWRQAIIQSVVEGVGSIDELTHYVVEDYEEFWKYAREPLDSSLRIAEILGYRRYLSDLAQNHEQVLLLN